MFHNHTSLYYTSRFPWFQTAVSPMARVFCTRQQRNSAVMCDKKCLLSILFLYYITVIWKYIDEKLLYFNIILLFSTTLWAVQRIFHGMILHLLIGWGYRLDGRFCQAPRECVRLWSPMRDKTALCSIHPPASFGSEFEKLPTVIAKYFLLWLTNQEIRNIIQLNVWIYIHI